MADWAYLVAGISAAPPGVSSTGRAVTSTGQAEYFASYSSFGGSCVESASTLCPFITCLIVNQITV